MQELIDTLQARADEHSRQSSLIRGAIAKLKAASTADGLSVETASKESELATAVRASGLTYTELARRLNCNLKTITRLVHGQVQKSSIVERLRAELAATK